MRGCRLECHEIANVLEILELTAAVVSDEERERLVMREEEEVTELYNQKQLFSLWQYVSVYA